MTLTRLTQRIAIGMTLVVCSWASADAISYPDLLAGAAAVQHGCVDFTMISEDTTEDTGGAGLFGMPSSDGAVLEMNPANFDAGPVNGAGVDFVDSHLETTISISDDVATGGLTSVTLDEIGDYTLVGNGEVQASINWFLDIPGASGVAAGTSLFNTTTAGTGNWQLDVAIDLLAGTYDNGTGGPMALVDANGDAITLPAGDIESVLFEFDNSLTARSLDATSSAFIKKKASNGVRVITETTKIPEPGSLSLLAFGFLGLMGFRRRN